MPYIRKVTPAVSCPGGLENGNQLALGFQIDRVLSNMVSITDIVKHLILLILLFSRIQNIFRLN